MAGGMDTRNLPSEALGGMAVGAIPENPALLDAFDQTPPEEVRKDSKYRKYAAAVEKTLSAFDTIREWADFIECLSRMGKTLEAYAQFTIIPQKAIVSKRLAQCLHPNLPGGVHAKALEVYSTVFDNIGAAQLAEDLPLWSVGLLPFLASASMTVKPALLAVYDKYYIPLGVRLRPATKALVLAWLPGLEEEGNEYFESVAELLDKLNAAIGSTSFYPCLWLNVISAPGLRRAAFNYLQRRMPRISSAQEGTLLLGDPCWFVRGMAVALEDRDVLVQRGALEVLLNFFPVRHVGYAAGDAAFLLEAVISVVLRKDMSLNRRVYAWLLGGSGSDALGGTARMAPETLDQLAGALGELFQRPHTDPGECAKPYKVLVSLLDRLEIGAPLVERLLPVILQSLHANLERVQDPAGDLLATANMFFEMVDPHVFWQALIVAVTAPPPARAAALVPLPALEMLDFVLGKVRLSDEDVLRVHLPHVFALMVAQLEGSAGAVCPAGSLERCGQLVPYVAVVDGLLSVSAPSWHKMLSAGPLASPGGSLDSAGSSPGDIFKRQVDSTTEENEEDEMEESEDEQTGVGLADELVQFYGSAAESNGPAESALSPVTSDASTPVLQSAPSRISVGERTGKRGRSKRRTGSLGGPTLVRGPAELLRGAFATVLAEFDELLKKLTTATAPALLPLLERVAGLTTRLWEFADEARLDALFLERGGSGDAFAERLVRACGAVDEFDTVDVLLSCALDILPQTAAAWRLRQRQFVSDAVGRLWACLTPDYTVFHLRATELIWSVGQQAGFVQVETLLAQYLSAATTADTLAKFGVFYRLSDEQHLDTAMRFSRPLLLVCDLLYSDDLLLRRLGETWLRNHVLNFVRLVEPLVHMITHSSILRSPARVTVRGHDLVVYHYAARPLFNQQQVVYAFATLQALCAFAPRDFARGTASVLVRSRSFLASVQWAESEAGVRLAKLRYSDLFVLVCARFLQSGFAPDADVSEAVRATNQRLQMQCAAFLAGLLQHLDTVPLALGAFLQDVLLKQLLFCIDQQILEAQVELLRVLGAFEQILAGIVSGVEAQRDGTRLLKLGSATRQVLRADAAVGAVPGASPAAASSDSDAASVEAIEKMTLSPLLQFVTQDAIVTHSNRRVLNHWIDFVLDSLVLLRNAFHRVVFPIVCCLCEEMKQFMANFARYNGLVAAPLGASVDGGRAARLAGSVRRLWRENLYLEEDVMVLMNALEKLVMVCLSDPRAAENITLALPIHVTAVGSGGASASSSVAAPTGTGGGTLRGLVSSLLFGDGSTSNESTPPGYIKTREAVLNLLPRVLRTYHDFWAAFDASSATAEFISGGGDSSGNGAPQAAGTTRGHHRPQPPSAMAPVSKLWTQFERDRQSSNARIGQRLHRKIQDFMDALFDLYPNDLVESLVEVWFTQKSDGFYEARTAVVDGATGTAISMLHSIQMCTPKHIIMAVFDVVKYRTLGAGGGGGSANGKRFLVREPELSDLALLVFLEEYCSLWMDLDSLAELLPYMLLYFREVFAQAGRFKPLFAALLRLATVCFDRAAQNQFYDDKRLRKDVEDVYARLIDHCVWIAGRSFDSALFRRNGSSEAIATAPVGPGGVGSAAAQAASAGVPVKSGSGSTTPVNAVLAVPPPAAAALAGAAALEQPGHVTTVALQPLGGAPATATPTAPTARIRGTLPRLVEDFPHMAPRSEEALVDEMIRDLAQRVFPALRRILQDTDRVAALLASVVQVVVAPVLKGKKGGHRSSGYLRALDLLCAMTKIPVSYRAWKKDVADCFLDARFFEHSLVSVEAARRWRIVLSAALAQERELFAEVMVRTNPSASLFSNNTQERAHMLRRLALLVLSVQPEMLAPLLPELQEKLAELLKAPDVPVLHVEVFLILQTLLFRASWKALFNLWPTVATTLMRLFVLAIRRLDTAPATGGTGTTGGGVGGVVGAAVGRAAATLLPESLSGALVGRAHPLGGDAGGVTPAAGGRSGEAADAALGGNPTFVAACLFLDLLICLAPEGFQPFEWVFISEVPSRAAADDGPSRGTLLDGPPTALVDQLWNRLVDRGTVSARPAANRRASGHSLAASGGSSSSLASAGAEGPAGSGRTASGRVPLAPLLVSPSGDDASQRRRAPTLAIDLHLFFSTASVAMLRAMHDMQQPDRDAIEELLEAQFVSHASFRRPARR